MGVATRGAARVGRMAFLAVLVVGAAVRPAAAEDGVEAAAARRADPAAPQALGHVFAAGPTAPALFLVSSGGYGYTESVLHTADTHHRAAGSVAVEGRPLDWLGLALRLDGRYDRHETAQGSDDGWIGDPRLFVRIDRALGSMFRAGVRLGVWFPGRAAPSIDLAATTPELTAALTCALPGSPLWLTANAGYRINRSARSATDANQLSASDRLGLELSAYDQALLGLAAVFGVDRVQGFLELSSELMLGAGSPPASASPLRAGAGIRLALNRDLRLEAAADVLVSERPALSMSSPLVPVPPRAAFWLGVAYRFGAAAPATPVRRAEPPPAPPPPIGVMVDGRVVAAEGEMPNQPRVTVQTSGDPDASSVDVGVDGRFTVGGNVGKTLMLRAEAEGYEPATESVTLAQDVGRSVTLTLRRKLPGAQIRGLIRSFKGAGLDAEIKIEPGDLTLHTKDGRFEADVAPGTYDVTISAPGYETQRRRVDVEQNGVTLLNADLRGTR